MVRMKEIDITSLGEALIDMFPAEIGRGLTQVSSFRPVPGGAPANVAVSGSCIGLRTAFIGKVGDDAFGHHLTAILKENDVDVRGIRYDKDARTGLAFIAMLDENNYEILFYRNPGADMLLKTDELDVNLLKATKALHFGSLSLAQKPSSDATMEAVRIAKTAGSLISFDVNYRPGLWESPHDARQRIMPAISQVHILKINETELNLLTQDTVENIERACRALLDKGPELVAVTLGPGGCYLHNQEGGVRIPGFEVKTVDATGSGDAFIAGLLSRLITVDVQSGRLTLNDMKRFGRYANAVAALTTQTKGVIPALPSKKEVDDFLSKQNIIF